MKVLSEIRPLTHHIPADRQGAKRHYGVHPYFTRRPFNVVRDYILHYSKEGDRVLDPFGGSGVVAIESFLENRIGMQNDINPLANFIANGVRDLERGNVTDYRRALAELQLTCRDQLQRINSASAAELLELIRNQADLPQDIPLPRTSDVDTYWELFSTKQLLSLAVIKNAIGKLGNTDARRGMLLAWSASLTKLNKTFLSAEGRAESRGGSSIFSIYRYKVAKKPIELSPWETFEERAKNVVDAKVEIDRGVEFRRQTSGWSGQYECYSENVSELENQFRGQIDYIFTDPPYGGHISYLDLSTLWNNWLGQMPSRKAQEDEIIVGGELGHSDSLYTERLRESIRSCVAMLKVGGWLSVVFQHWKVAYFQAILDGAAEGGAELRSAVSQVGDPIWSMHKKKGNQSVLAGELILTFEKTEKKPKLRPIKAFNIETTVYELLETAGERVYGEELFNNLVIAAWRSNAIESLTLSKDAFIAMISSKGWSYNPQHHYWTKQQERVADTLWD